MSSLSCRWFGLRSLKWRWILVLPIFLGFTGCSGLRQATIPDPSSADLYGIQIVPYSQAEIYEKLMDHFKNWKGTAYRLGGMSKRGIDCSAFVHVTYKEKVRIHLPRTTLDLARSGMRISRQNLTIGDLILFKTGFFSRHVGIYIENGRFIHASKTDGVTLSNLNEEYWSGHYWMARRIIEPAKPTMN